MLLVSYNTFFLHVHADTLSCSHLGLPLLSKHSLHSPDSAPTLHLPPPRETLIQRLAPILPSPSFLLPPQVSRTLPPVPTCRWASGTLAAFTEPSTVLGASHMLSNLTHHQPCWDDIRPILQVCLLQSLCLFYKDPAACSSPVSGLRACCPTAAEGPIRTGRGASYSSSPYSAPTLNSCQSILNRVGTIDQSVLM